jgi:DNA polymerase III delta subunit
MAERKGPGRGASDKPKDTARRPKERREREPDPDAQIAALEQALGGGPLPRAVLLRGDERWFRESALRVAVDAAKRGGLEISRHDAGDPDFSLSALTSDLLAAPMFAAARCVVLRNANAVLKKDEGELPPAARALSAFVGDTHSPGLAIVEAEGLRADHPLVKAVLARGGHVLNLRRLWDGPPPWSPDPRRSELVLWLQSRARTRRIALSADEALYVATATGNDLFALEAALDRLLQARGGQGVRDLVGWSSGGSPFELAEHMVAGDAAKSVAGIEGLFKLGFTDKGGEREVDRTALLAITLGALRSKLRQSLSAALAMERGESLEDAVKASGAPAFQKSRDELAVRLRARKPAAWREMMDDLLEVERRTRRGALVDASDMTALALRWRLAARTDDRASARMHADVERR